MFRQVARRGRQEDGEQQFDGRCIRANRREERQHFRKRCDCPSPLSA
jgi:hypothetical protein